MFRVTLPSTLLTLVFAALIPALAVGCASTTPRPVEGEIWGRIRVNHKDPAQPARVETASGKKYRLSGTDETLLRSFHEGWMVHLNGLVLQNPEGGDEGSFEIQEVLETREP